MIMMVYSFLHLNFLTNTETCEIVSKFSFGFKSNFLHNCLQNTCAKAANKFLDKSANVLTFYSVKPY